jgi:hypothetical protein
VIFPSFLANPLASPQKSFSTCFHLDFLLGEIFKEISFSSSQKLQQQNFTY